MGNENIKFQERTVIAISFFWRAELGRYSRLALLSWGALEYSTAKIAGYFPISAKYQLC
jgi:hypothetical protein